MKNQNDEMNLYNIIIVNSNNSRNTKNSKSYSQLYIKVKSLTWVIFKIFFQLQLFLLVGALIIILIQFIDANKINYAELFIISGINIIILVTFFANIFSIRRLLIRLKSYSIMKWSDKYTEIINKYISENNKNSENITQINDELSVIIQILEREESLLLG